MMNEEIYKQYAGLIDNEMAKSARKALDYFDGEQQKHMIELLNSYGTGRTNWQTRGIIPRHRNLTKMIVEKSGLLFINEAPKLEVYANAQMLEEDDTQSTAYLEILNKAGWVDTFINLDQVTRLLKTTCLLVNYDQETDNIIFDILHRGNCEVIINPNNREIMMVVYITGEYGTHRCFRIIAKDTYTDFDVDNQGNVSNVIETPNPYGMVPVVPFYDTQKPRMGFWVEAPQDLVGMNEMYNIHLTDAEFCIKWEKYPTLFTNLQPANSQRNVETFTDSQSSPSARSVLFGNGGTASAGNVGGPDRMVQMDGQGVDNPFIDYKSPQVDLTSLDEVFNKWVKDFAYDWSVRVKVEGEGGVQSGFALAVEELDNVQLRKLRQRMFEAGLTKLYETIKHIWNLTHNGNTFTPDSYCEVEFDELNLPVDAKIDEEVWSLRIDSGRASLVDYFQSRGYTRPDAEEKVKEIQMYKDMFGQAQPPVNTEAANTPEQETETPE